jgi:quercetin dioxygenase-like cupin family protein
MTDVKRDRPTGETGGSDQRPARRLAAPVLTFDLAKEVASLKQEPSWARGDRNARTLVEDAGFRLVLTVLKTGARMHEHRAAGWVSLQGLGGHLRLQAGEHTAELTAGRVVVLEPDLPHSVEAVEEGAFLLSIAPSSSAGKRD